MRRSLVAVSLLLAMMPQLARADALQDGIDRVQRGDYDNAIPLLQQAAEALPDDLRPYIYLEKAYEALYRPGDALAAHEKLLARRERLAKPKPKTAPSAEPDPLPPVYVKPGPRKRLPAITNDMIPKQPQTYKATPVDLPKAAKPKAGTASDTAAKGAVAPPAVPAAPGEASPAPRLEPIYENTGLNAPPVIAPPPAQPNP